MSGGSCAQAFPSTIDNDNCGTVRPWNVPLRYFKVNRAAMQRRAAMVPYFYTLVREAYDTGLGPLRPMYYEFPEHDEAYYSDMNGKFAQYFYGNDMFVAPVVEPAANNVNDTDFTGLTSKQVWVPPGTWVEKDRGLVVKGPQTITRNYALEEIPQFIRVGAMIPTLPHIPGDTIGKATETYKAIIWTIYLGDDGSATEGSGSIYEDDGTTMKYLKQSSTPGTTASFQNNGRLLEFVVNSSTEKQWTLRVVNSLLPKSITFDGKITIPYSRFPTKSGVWSWDGATGELIVNIPTVTNSVKLSIIWENEHQQSFNGVQGAVFLSTIAKHALDEVRQSVGSQTGQVGYGGALDKLAGSGQTFAYEAGMGDSGKTFFTHLTNMKTLVSNAMVEVKNITLPGGADGTRRLAYVESLMDEVVGCV
jgi:hypothetical protein